MTCHRTLPGLAGKRLKAIRPNLGPESRGNLLRFPTGHHFEAMISGYGDSESDGLSKTPIRHRRSLQHIAADIGRCRHHDWLERQPDEALDCFS
jgi:predicted acyl esterase